MYDSTKKTYAQQEALRILITGDPCATPEEVLFAYIVDAFENPPRFQGGMTSGAYTDTIDHARTRDRSEVERRKVRGDLFVWRVVHHKRNDPAKRWNSPVNRWYVEQTIEVGIASNIEEATTLGRSAAIRLAKDRAGSQEEETQC